MSAVLTLFCNILSNPLDPQTGDDLELLRTAPELIKGIRLRRLATNEIQHTKMIEDFVAELLRLGSSAIQKAREDEQAQL